MIAGLLISQTSFAIEGESLQTEPNQTIFSGQKTGSSVYTHGLFLFAPTDGASVVGEQKPISGCYFKSDLTAKIIKAYVDQFSPEEIPCDGLSTEQLSSIDFTKIDTSSLSTSIKNSADTNN